ncbi:centrosomal protein POC5 isoform X3 [Neophocaena asiaeorientalis asiaeorientalis]|uniref:Centrosomal protein POC5 n=1 Tax=Neophocaena asiaeorientalis asiaeorientalis TaxID=1706337 RepID=A0A341AHI2_NEOAA|nr:centrosomal protein POC5 isoform X3 [Neophocaena asiaeorientalis asiaeorientalis]XP_032484642.1 centrosomal protein POC5 isoform X3 [Phocoena sinus]
MSSDEEKCSPPVLHNESDRGSSVSSELQEEYEELLRYAIVTPNIESSASQPSHSKGEVVPDIRIPTIIDDILQNPAGNSPAVRETRMEVGKRCDLNISSHSKTDGSSPVSSPRKSPHLVMDFFSSNLLVDSSSPRSNSSPVDAHEVVGTDFLISDENLQKMENVLDHWSSGLKTNIISELSKWRLNFIDWHRMEMKKEREKHAADIKQLCSQINSLKELQKTYEVSIGRKDEVYESKLADQYFQRTLLKKVWRGWRAIVQKQWKEVVERACQARAEEVCVQISNDYEAKVAVLSGALENAKAEIQRMQHEKEHFEDSMKKAFMRGVCALNLEAMTIFQSRGDTGTDFTNNKREEYGPGVQGKEHSSHLDPSAPPLPSAVPPSPPAAALGATCTAAFPSAASITPAGAASTSSVHLPVSAPHGAASTATASSTQEEMYGPRVVTSAQQKAGRTITARITGKCDFASKNRISSSLAIMGVSPPMSSVVVEKHHPVTVQTIPQATAAKYPRTIHSESSTSASRSLGTRSSHTQSLTSIQSIKVVD